MIIDVHSHDFPDAIATRAMNGMCRMTEGLLWPTGDGSLQNHLDHLDLAGVDKAVSCQIATKPKMKNVRGLKFIAAHLGGCDGYPPHATDRVLDSGAYIDTSILHRRWHYDEPMRLVRSWTSDRILFGTDFPWTHYPEAITWVKSLRDPKDWDALFGGNACRLLVMA